MSPRAKKHLSQNFLYDPVLLERIIQVAELNETDTVLEIGPGPGKLTELMAKRTARLIAIELDPDLYARLRIIFATSENVELHSGDALEFDYASVKSAFKVVANIPYHITTPIIFGLLEHRNWLQSMTLTVQKEVAERIAAPPGNKKYGVLSLMVQYYCQATLKFNIPKEAFRPVPKVDSACIHMKVLPSPSVKVIDEALFFKLIRTAFTHRRKTVSNSLKAEWPEIKDALAQTDIDAGLRPEMLSIEDYARLSDILVGLNI